MAAFSIFLLGALWFLVVFNAFLKYVFIIIIIIIIIIICLFVCFFYSSAGVTVLCVCVCVFVLFFVFVCFYRYCQFCNLLWLLLKNCINYYNASCLRFTHAYNATFEIKYHDSLAGLIDDSRVSSGYWMYGGTTIPHYPYGILPGYITLDTSSHYFQRQWELNYFVISSSVIELNLITGSLDIFVLLFHVYFIFVLFYFNYFVYACLLVFVFTFFIYIYILQQSANVIF